MNTNFIQSLDGLSQLDFGNGSGYLALTSDGQDYIEPYCYVSNGNISSRAGVLGYSFFKIGIGDNLFADNFIWGNQFNITLNHNTQIDVTAPLIQLTTDNGGYSQSFIYVDTNTIEIGTNGIVSYDATTTAATFGNLTLQEVYLTPGTTGSTQVLIITALTTYADDLAADADPDLLSGSLYLLTGDRTVYRKP